MVGRIAAVSLTNLTTGLSVVNRDYEADYKPSGKGDTIRVRVLADLRAYDGPDITSTGANQVLTESYLSIVLNQDKNVPVTIPNKDMTLEIQDFKQQVTDQQMIPMADKIDTFIFGTIPLLCPNIVGEPGITPASDEVISDAGVRLSEMGCPWDQRKFVLNPKARGALATYIKAISNSAINAAALRRGHVGQTANMEFLESNNISSHTNGGFDGTPIVNGATQIGSTIEIDGFGGGGATDVLLKGDIITFAGCFAVKPVSGDILPYLKQFVVTADADAAATGTGEASVSIYPAIDTAIPGKTCSASPTNGGAVTLFGGASTTYTRNLACHKKAMTFAMSPLHPLDGGSVSYNVSHEGLSLLYSAGDSIYKRETVKRYDALYGGLLTNPNMCCLIAGE